MITFPPAFLIRLPRFNSIRAMYESLLTVNNTIKITTFNRANTSLLLNQYTREFAVIVYNDEQAHDDLMIDLLTNNPKGLEHFSTKPTYIKLKETRARLKKLRAIT